MTRQITVKPEDHLPTKSTEVAPLEIEYRVRRLRPSLLEQVLTKDEFYALLQEAKGTEKVVLCLGILGLRANEISRCCSDWIDWSEKVITIPEPAAKKGHGRRVWFGSSPIFEIISSYFVLSNRIGMTRQGIWQAVKRVAQRVGHRKPISVHALRATGATWAADKGLSPQALLDLFGWDNLKTAQFYIKKSGRVGIEEIKEKGGII